MINSIFLRNFIFNTRFRFEKIMLSFMLYVWTLRQYSFESLFFLLVQIHSSVSSIQVILSGFSCFLWSNSELFFELLLILGNRLFWIDTSVYCMNIGISTRTISDVVCMFTRSKSFANFAVSPWITNSQLISSIYQSFPRLIIAWKESSVIISYIIISPLSVSNVMGPFDISAFTDHRG